MEYFRYSIVGVDIMYEFLTWAVIIPLNLYPLSRSDLFMYIRCPIHSWYDYVDIATQVLDKNTTVIL